MKTSNVGSKPPASAGTESEQKQKGSEEAKPTKQFKEVLAGGQQAQPQARSLKKKSAFPPFGKGAYAKKRGKSGGEKSDGAEGLALGKSREKGAHPLHGERGVQKTLRGEGESKEVPLLKSGKEKDLDSMLEKKEKENVDDSSMTVPGGVLMGPSALQQKAAIAKADARGLSMSDMESIVQKVQVGVNEKGMPEFRFELMTDKLGSLDLNVTADGSKIKIEILAQDAGAQAELEKNLNELGEMLQRRGLTLAEAQVNTRDEDAERRQRQEEQRQQHGEQQDQESDL